MSSKQATSYNDNDVVVDDDGWSDDNLAYLTSVWLAYESWIFALLTERGHMWREESQHLFCLEPEAYNLEAVCRKNWKLDKMY